MERKILSAKVQKDGTLEVNWEEYPSDGGTPDVNTRVGGNIVHPDLLAAFEALTIHLAVRGEQNEFTYYEDHPEKLESFKLTGFTMGGEDEHVGVTLIGRRMLAHNNILNLVPPFIKLNADNSNYPFASSLDEDLTHARTEVSLYIDGTKKGQRAQLELNLGGEDDDNDSDEIEKPKKRGRKAKVKELA